MVTTRCLSSSSYIPVVLQTNPHPPSASVCSYDKQRHQSNLWLKINHRPDQCISTPGTERKPQTDMIHQLLNIDICMLSKQPFPDMITFTDMYLKNTDDMILQPIWETQFDKVWKSFNNQCVVWSPFGDPSEGKGKYSLSKKSNKDPLWEINWANSQSVIWVCFLDITIARLLLHTRWLCSCSHSW